MNEEKRCENCYYYDEKVCQCEGGCDRFTPLSDEDQDALLDEEIEEARLEYREVWFAYVKEE